MSDEGASPDEPASEADHPPAAPPAPEKRRFDRARLARLVALAGILAVVLIGRSLVLPHIPVTHDVQLRPAAPQEVTGIDVRWSAPGSDDDIFTTSLHFSAGTAPSTIPASVRLPDGAYDVTITVARTSGTDTTRRRITLEDEARVTIPLR